MTHMKTGMTPSIYAIRAPVPAHVWTIIDIIIVDYTCLTIGIGVGICIWVKITRTSSRTIFLLINKPVIRSLWLDITTSWTHSDRIWHGINIILSNKICLLA
jgi:hypothetical protein